MPFTTEQFFAVFVQYNEGVWPAQIFLNLLALMEIALLCAGKQTADRMMAGILAFLWTWMAIVYHFMFFAMINPAAWAFGMVFLLGAVWMFWIGVIKGQLHFEVSFGLRGILGSILVIYALLLYPLLGYLFGHAYPALPTFGLPCPTCIFTLGLLLFASVPVPRSLYIVPLIWVVVGSFAAFKLGVYQDYGLLLAGVIALMVVVPGQIRERMYRL